MLASVQQLDSMHAINVRGVFLCYKYGALQMIKQGHGGRLIGKKIVLSFRISDYYLIYLLGASSSAGKEGELMSRILVYAFPANTGSLGTPNLAAYSSTKFAIRGLTQTAGES